MSDRTVICQVRTHYRTHPGSNVGKYVAQAMGRSASLRTDQVLSSDANHERVVMTLVRRLLFGVHDVVEGVAISDVSAECIESSDDGQRRAYEVTRP